MTHWRGVLPEHALLDVPYETLVGDFEAQARRIVAFCGLEWDARCLDFSRTERPVRTLSPGAGAPEAVRQFHRAVAAL